MNLREKRLEKGMTQKALAEACGMNRTRITNYEIGNRQPRLEDAKTIAAALDCTVDELIELKNPRDNGEDNEDEGIEEQA